MRDFTITELEWHNVVDKVQVIEKENEKLKGVIEGMNKVFSLYGVSNRRELLINFLDDVLMCQDEGANIVDREKYVDVYLGNL